MKKYSLIIFLLIMIIGAGSVLGDPYGYGEDVPVMFVVPDTADGQPITPDSIFISVYYRSGATPVVDETAMTNWDGQTGEYCYTFTTPDSAGIYSPRLRWKAQGKEYVLRLDNICVADNFDAASDTIMANLAEVSGSISAADNLKYFLDGTGSNHDVVLSAKRLSLENNDGNAAFYVYNSGGSAAKFYTSHIATGESWSYGLALLAGSGQTAPLRIIGGGSYTGIHGNLLGSVASVTNKVTLVDSTAGDISSLANAGLSTFDPSTDSVNARANVHSISGDSDAADNLKYFLDGTGHTHGVELSANQLKLSGNYYSEGALHVENAGGNAAYFKTTSQIGGAAGLYLFGNNDYDNLYGLNIVGDAPGGDALGNWSGTITTNDTNAGGQTLAVAPDNWSTDDSAAYQGAASGLTAANVWNYTGRTVEGGWVDSNRTEIGSSVGDGMYSRIIAVIDSNTQNPVPGVRVAVRSVDQSVFIAGGVTNNDGQVGFNLDEGDFLILAHAPSYIFESYDTITVNGPGEDSLSGFRFDPGSPPEPDLCRVYGYVYDITANPETNAEIEARLSPGVRRFGGAVVSPLVRQTQSDSLGYFHIDLIPSARLEPDSSAYEISITLSDGTILREKVAVPDQDSWQLTW